MRMNAYIKNIKDLLKAIGFLSAKLIRDDAKKSIWQNETKGGKYSKQYAKYKRNNMRSFLTGQRLKPYYGVSIVSNSTKPDLHLTGQMFNGLTVKEIGDDYVEMSYNPMDAGKVSGAIKAGRDILNLNKKNQKIIQNYIKTNMQFSAYKKNFNVKINLGG